MRFVTYILALMALLVPASLRGNTIEKCRVPVNVNARMADSVMRLLDSEIGMRPKRMADKELQIEQLKKTMARVADDRSRYAICSDLFDEYSNYQSDSAYVYASRMLDIAKKLGDPAREAETQSKFLTFAGPVGLFNEALYSIGKTDTSALTVRQKTDYFLSCSFLYENISALAAGNDSLRHRYTALHDDYIDKVVASGNDDLPEYQFALLKKRLSQTDNPRQRVTLCRDFIDKHPLNAEGRAVMYYLLGCAYRDAGDTTAATYYLSESALQDLRACNNETMAAQTLASLLLDEGDEHRADRYIRLSLDEAEFYNSMLRRGQIIHEFNRIQASRQSSLANGRIVAYSLTAAVGLLLAAVVVLVVKLRRTNRRLRSETDRCKEKTRQIGDAYNRLQTYTGRLEESADVKNRAILDALFDSQLFIGEVESTAKKIEIKANARLTDDIVRMVRKLDVKAEGMRLRSTFDTIFLSAFPDFLEQVNKLLKPAAHLTLNDDGTLPTEARIFALMRMGITDPQLVAKYLNVSVNTIYVYKARIKAQTLLDKDAFDKAIMDISPLTD